jgi:hypothetical protein
MISIEAPVFQLAILGSGFADKEMEIFVIRFVWAIRCIDKNKLRINAIGFTFKDLKVIKTS